MRKVGKSIFYEEEEEEITENIHEIEKGRNEIVTSEAEYLGHLRVLTEAYIKPLSSVLSPSEAHQLFGNIHTVTECSEKLLGELCNSLATPDLYQVLVAAATSYLRAYVPYCANLPSALTLLSRLLQERECFREKVCESGDDERGIGLQSYLLKPFQRLTRLPLLLAPLVKAGDPADSAARAITQLVEECNNSVVEEETEEESKSKQEQPTCRRSSSFYVGLDD